MDYVLLGVVSFQMVLGIFFVIFTAWMLYDQYVIIKEDTTSNLFYFYFYFYVKNNLSFSD